NKLQMVFALVLLVAGAILIASTRPAVQAGDRGEVVVPAQPAPVKQAAGPILRGGGGPKQEGGLHLVGVLKLKLASVRTLAFSPDGRMLAAGGSQPAERDEVLLWDLAASKELATLRAVKGRVSAVAFRPDGRSLLTVSAEENLIGLWDVATAKQL